MAVTCLGEEEEYLVGQEVASEEGAHVEEGLGADQAGGQVEGQVVAQVGGLVVEVEVKAHADLVNQEVSGKEELLVEDQEEGQWVVLGASVEGLEAVLAEVAQAWEGPVSGWQQQTGRTVAAAALRLQWKTQSLQELPHCVAAAVVVMSPQTLSRLPPPPPLPNIPPLLSLLLEFPDLPYVTSWPGVESVLSCSFSFSVTSQACPQTVHYDLISFLLHLLSPCHCHDAGSPHLHCLHLTYHCHCHHCSRHACLDPYPQDSLHPRWY